MAYTSKQFVVLSFSAVLLGVALVYGLKASLPSEAEGPITVERVFDEWGLKLSMSVGKSVYAFEEPVNVTLMLTSIGNETVKYMLGSGHRFDFAVYNNSDRSKTSFVYGWSALRGFFPVLETITLNPGDSISTTLEWPYYEKRAQGTYYIFGMSSHIGWMEYGAKRSNEPFGFLYMEEPIEVTILPP